MKHTQFTKAFLVFFIALLLLTSGFYRNQWKTAGKKWFYDWKKQSDYMVVGRLAQSRESGILSESGLLGMVDGEFPLPPGIVERQYDVYLGQLAYQGYWAYKSSPGLHGALFSFFDQITNYPENFNLKIFSGITSTLSALVLSLLVVWVFLELGCLPALFSLLFMIFSEWLTLFGGSIYWQLWAFYLPALLLLISLRRQGIHATYLHSKRLFGIVFFSILIKVIFTGFEFISVALMMIYPPIVYYAVLHRLALKEFFSLSFQLGISAVLGALVGLGILLAQVSGVLGGLQPAIGFIAMTFARRTHGNPDLYPVEAAGLEASLVSVIWQYMTGRAINLGMWIENNSRFVFLQDISYLPIFILLGFVSLLFLFLYFTDQASIRRQSKALFAATWVSLLGPLSWLIVFKAHASIHGNLDYIIWQMPFMLLGFALCGDVARMMFVRLIKQQP